MLRTAVTAGVPTLGRGMHDAHEAVQPPPWATVKACAQDVNALQP